MTTVDTVPADVAAYLIVRYLSSWTDEKLAGELARIGAGAIDGQFVDEASGKMYALLLLEQRRRMGLGQH